MGGKTSYAKVPLIIWDIVQAIKIKTTGTAIRYSSPPSIRGISNSIFHPRLGDIKSLIGMNGKDDRFLLSRDQVGEDITD